MENKPNYILNGYSKPKLVFGDSNGRFRIYNRKGYENTGDEKFVCQRAKQKCSARVAKKVSGEYEIYDSHLPDCKIYTESKILIMIELEQLKNKVCFIIITILYYIKLF